MRPYPALLSWFRMPTPAHDLLITEKDVLGRDSQHGSARFRLRDDDDFQKSLDDA